MSTSSDDNELMRKINVQFADNKHQPWSISDDQYLYDHRELPIEDLVDALKRGKNGLKARIKHLSDPNHNAHRRLFNIETVVVPTLRPVIDVINRILYDPSLDPADFSFCFLVSFPYLRPLHDPLGLVLSLSCTDFILSLFACLFS